MEQKLKFILIGLMGVLLIFIFLYLQSINSKRLLLRERNDLKKENTSLTNKTNKLESGIRGYENKLSSLNKELDRISQEKQEIERKYELVNKEKEELIGKMQALQTRVAQAPQPQQVLPPNTEAYWAEMLKAKTDLEFQLGNFRNELKSTQINNEQLQRDKSTLELDINILKRDKEDLKRQLEYNQKLMDSIAQELVRERNDKIQIQDSFKSIKNENTVLTRQLKSLNDRKVNLERRLQELQEGKAAIERRFTEMETMLTDKVSKINDLKEQLDAIRRGAKIEIAPQKKESVELPPIVVRPQSETPMQETTATLEGSILAVNKESNFVIIDLGLDAGIKVGDILQIYREDKFIATIEVIQTRKSIAACDIKRETVAIKIGDTVK